MRLSIEREHLATAREGWSSWVVVGNSELYALLGILSDSRWTRDELVLLKETLLTAKEALQGIGVTNWRETFGDDMRFERANEPYYNAFYLAPDAGHQGIVLMNGVFSGENSLTTVFVILHEMGHAIDRETIGWNAITSGNSMAALPLGPTVCMRDYSCADDRELWADGFATYAITAGSPYDLNVDANAMLQTMPGWLGFDTEHSDVNLLIGQTQKMLQTYLGN